MRRMSHVEMRVTGVGVLDKAVALLDAAEQQPQTAAELARLFDMSVSTTHRLAAALEAHGLLVRDEEGRFRLGARFATSALSEVGTPYLTELRDATGESAQLWVRRGESRLCLASVDSPHELRMTVPAGGTIPLPLGSAGQVLAHPADEPRPDWCESVGIRTPGAASVSAPVLLRGRPAAAVCLSGPIQRIGDRPGERYGSLVADIARRIAAALTA